MSLLSGLSGLSKHSGNNRTKKHNGNSDAGSVIYPNGKVKKAVSRSRNGSIVSGKSNKYEDNVESIKAPKSKVSSKRNRNNADSVSINSVMSAGYVKQKQKTAGMGSTVSSNIEKRKSRSRVGGITKRRSSTLNSERNGSLTDLDVESNLVRSQSEGMLDECALVMQSLECEELDALLMSIKKFHYLKEQERRRKERIRLQISRIKTRLEERHQPQSHSMSIQAVCCICKSRWLAFLPNFFRQSFQCNQCHFDTCRDCIRYDFQFCKDCYDLLTSEAKLCDVFNTDEVHDICSDVKSLEKIAKEVKDKESKIRSSDTYDFGDYENTNQQRKEGRGSMHTSSMSLNEIALLNNNNIDSSNSTSSYATKSNYYMQQSHGYRSAIENADCTGQVLLSVSYDFKKQTLQVHITAARELQPCTKQGVASTFVKMCLLPDSTGSNRRRTKVCANTLAPEYNEIVKFKFVPWDELLSRFLHATVWHHEWLVKDVFLGEIKIKLDKFNFDDASAKWYDLMNKRPINIHPSLTKYCGDLQISIKVSISDSNTNPLTEDEMASSDLNPKGGFLKPDQCELLELENKSLNISLWIKKASNLLTGKYDKQPSSYVKCVILPEKDFNMKKKTPVIRKNFNPDWNTMMEFSNIMLHEAKVVLELSVWDKKVGLIPDVLLGVVFLDIKSAANRIQKVYQEHNKQFIANYSNVLKSKDQNDELLNQHQHEEISDQDRNSEEKDFAYKILEQRNRWIDVRLPLTSIQKSDYEAMKL